MRIKMIGLKIWWLFVNGLICAIATTAPAEVPLRKLSESKEPSQAVLKFMRNNQGGIRFHDI